MYCIYYLFRNFQDTFFCNFTVLVGSITLFYIDILNSLIILNEYHSSYYVCRCKKKSFLAEIGCKMLLSYVFKICNVKIFRYPFITFYFDVCYFLLKEENQT